MDPRTFLPPRRLFAIDAQAIVRRRSLPAHAGELPDLDAALRAIT